MHLVYRLDCRKRYGSPFLILRNIAHLNFFLFSFASFFSVYTSLPFIYSFFWLIWYRWISQSNFDDQKGPFLSAPMHAVGNINELIVIQNRTVAFAQTNWILISIIVTTKPKMCIHFCPLIGWCQLILAYMLWIHHELNRIWRATNLNFEFVIWNKVCI